MPKITSQLHAGRAQGVISQRDEEMLKEFKKHLVTEKGRQSSTYDTYAADSLALARFLKPRGRDLVGASPEDLEAFLDRLEKTNANATLLRKVTSLRSFYRFLLIDEYIEIDPTLNLNVTKTSTLKRKSMTQEEVMKMLTPKSPLPRDPLKRALFLRDNAIVHSLYGEALRESEAIKMGLDDLHMDSSTVLIRGKGNKERMLPLVQPVEDAMSLYLKEGRGLLKERANSKGGDRGSSS